ncbi:MAG: rhodanese-like domain-containing protein [Deinococcus sp.]|nr:rhodanese-like domain-containing protein [Deinococcus sp.]
MTLKMTFPGLLASGLLGVLGLTACAPAGSVDDRTADVAALQAAHRSGAYVLDVRTPAEYAGGHISGATLIPLAELSGRMGEVPRDRDVYVICRSGNRSAQASALLMDAGYERVINVAGGMGAWQRAGYPVSR